METHFTIVSPGDGEFQKECLQKGKKKQNNKASDVSVHVKEQFTFLADSVGMH